MENLGMPGHNVPSEVVNIVDIIKNWGNGDSVLTEIGDQVCIDFDNDDSSRREWKEGVQRSIKLFTNFLPRKTSPWDNASNINLPMLAVACLQFQARAFDAIIPPKGVVNTIATGDEDLLKADRVAKYMNYELLYKMDDFEEGMDKSLIQLPIEGTVFRKTYFDPIAGRNRSEYISASDLVVSYNYKGSVEDAPRKTHVLYMRQNDINMRARAGIYTSDAFNTIPAVMDVVPISDTIRKTADEIKGISSSPNPFDRDPYRIVLEQHRGWDLDGDGIEEPYVITVDYATRKVWRITDRRFADWKGDIQTIEYFTKYDLIPDPEHFYGLGFGILLTGINEAANEIVNEVIDAGHLANMQGGFISRRSGIKRGSLTFKRGEFKEVDTYIDDLKKAIFSFDFKGPNQTLYAVLGLLYEYSKLVSSVSETMTGQLPASDTPASTVMALIEEGRKVFSSIHKRIHRAFKKELSKLFRLNSIFLDERTYFLLIGTDRIPVMDENGRTIEIPIGRSDFTNKIDVIPVSDPMITSRAEKVMKAQTAYQLTLTSPLTASNQNAIFEAQKALYEALEIPNWSSILQPPPPPPDLSPEDENAQMIQEKPVTALPHQDHLHHIGVHDQFVNGEFGMELSPTTKQLLQQHRQQHLAGLYMQQVQEQQIANAKALEAVRGF